MDSLTDFKALVAVVDAGSLGAAAKSTGVAKSTLSRALTRLEERLETPLFERSGAKVIPTGAGLALARRARRALGLLEQGEVEAKLEHEGRGGPLRISLPRNAGDGFHRELVLRVLRTLPEVRLEIHASDRYLDLVDEQIDVAIRAGRVGAADWISTTLVQTYWGLFGQLGGAHPQTVDELDGVPLLLVSRGGHPVWPWNDPPLARYRIRLLSDNIRTVAAAAAEGQGVAVVSQGIAAGRLEPVLPELRSAAAPLLAMWPASRQGDPRVRTVVDAVREFFGAGLPT